MIRLMSAALIATLAACTPGPPQPSWRRNPQPPPQLKRPRPRRRKSPSSADTPRPISTTKA